MTADDQDKHSPAPASPAPKPKSAAREGMSERSVGKVETDAEGNFKLNFTDKLTGETLSIIVSKAGHITAKGPVSIQTQGKKTLVVLKKLTGHPSEPTAQAAGLGWPASPRRVFVDQNGPLLRTGVVPRT